MKLNNKGFTLVEVLAVVVILGVIAGIAVTGVLSSINKSKKASYNLMISDIVIASQMLYEEIDFGKDYNLYSYNDDGITEDLLTISDYKINTNLQSLVSNGFLSGSENPCKDSDTCSNKNKRILLNPSTSEDIGSCNIIIENNDGEYIVRNNSSDDSKCPDSYVKEVK